MLLQIYVAMKAMPWYTLLPTINEYLTENGWTKCFPRASHVSLPAYLVYIAIYLVMVEFGIYWMHRELHDIKPLYKYLHATHHIYNKQNTLSPFAGEYIIYSTKYVASVFISSITRMVVVISKKCLLGWISNGISFLSWVIWCLHFAFVCCNRCYWLKGIFLGVWWDHLYVCFS